MLETKHMYTKIYERKIAWANQREKAISGQN